jgi:2-C-methyl-D-erythritol 4-phosphate cytidylyltransferase
VTSGSTISDAVTEDQSSEGTRVGVAIPAAGSGTRMGGTRKPFLELLGEPILLHSLRPFLAERRVVSLCVALAPEDAADPPTWLLELGPRVVVVTGGDTRGDSVSAAIAGLVGTIDVIAVHDAARPLVRGDVVSACVDLAATGIGALAGCPAVDTMKTVDSHRRIVETADRSVLWHAHTPQVFPADVLRAAYAGRDRSATDEAALVERLGNPVEMVDDGGLNLKVTRPGDVPLAEAILRARAHE